MPKPCIAEHLQVAPEGGQAGETGWRSHWGPSSCGEGSTLLPLWESGLRSEWGHAAVTCSHVWWASPDLRSGTRSLCFPRIPLAGLHPWVSSS